MEIRIRKAKPADIGQIIGNWKSLMEQNMGFNPKAFRHKKNYEEIYRRFLLKQVKGRVSTVFVAEKEGRIIGHIMLEIKLMPPVYEIDREGFVDELFVKEGFRRQGVGTRLLEEGEKWARKKGMRQFSLHANARNSTARKAYKSFGLEDLTIKMSKLL